MAIELALSWSTSASTFSAPTSSLFWGLEAGAVQSALASAPMDASVQSLWVQMMKIGWKGPDLMEMNNQSSRTRLPA
jgi:hypothetical protein